MGDASRGLGPADGMGDSRGDPMGEPYGEDECTSNSVVIMKAGL